MLRDDLQLIRKRLDDAKTIAIFAHIRPDGDSIGSALSLGWALEDIGKNVQYICDDQIPEKYRFLFQFTRDGKDPFILQPENADCYVTPDISSPDRAGLFFDNQPELQADICIDHHISNNGHAKLNWIEPESPAACAVIAGILPKMGFTLTKRISSALLCGIITDTNSFSTSNVNAQSLRIAADLVDNGADIFQICHKAHKEHSTQEIDFWRIGMKHLHMENGLAWSIIPKADRDAMGIATDEETDFVSYMGDTANIKVSVLFTEVDPVTTKISWRALPGYDVSKTAIYFGGGGHKAASGATMHGQQFQTVVDAVLKKTKEMLFRS